MKIDIKLDLHDIGFQYDSVKSLLTKFSEIQKVDKSQLEEFRVRIPEKVHDLSLALIWRLMRHYQDLPCKKGIYYPNKIKQHLDKRHWFDRLTGRKSEEASSDVPVNYETFAPFANMDEETGGVTAEKVYDNSMNLTLDMEKEICSEIKIHIHEILNNVFNHSKLKHEAGIVCETNKDIISICTVDMGQGIKNSFLSNPTFRNEFLPLPDEEAIRRATKFKTSCNPEHSPHPHYKTKNAGIGLYFLKKFAMMHRNGQFIIISKKGYYYVDCEGREIQKNFVDIEWPGTLVYFRVNLNQSLSPEYMELAQHI